MSAFQTVRLEFTDSSFKNENYLTYASLKDMRLSFIGTDFSCWGTMKVIKNIHKI